MHVVLSDSMVREQLISREVLFHDWLKHLGKLQGFPVLFFFGGGEGSGGEAEPFCPQEFLPISSLAVQLSAESMSSWFFYFKS